MTTATDYEYYPELRRKILAAKWLTNIDYLDNLYWEHRCRYYDWQQRDIENLIITRRNYLIKNGEG